MKTKKVNIPKKGAGRALAQKLKDLGNQKPPKDLVDKLNRGNGKEKEIAAAPRYPDCDMEM